MKKIQDVSRSIEIHATPDACYAALCDIQGYLSWFKHVKSLDVKNVNNEGRPSRVYFTFDLLVKKGMKIVLNYSYDDDRRKLSYESGGGDIAGASGNFHFRALPPDRTLFVFILRVDFGMLVPETIVEFLSGRVLDDFVAMVKEECERRSDLYRAK